MKLELVYLCHDICFVRMDEETNVEINEWVGEGMKDKVKQLNVLMRVDISVNCKGRGKLEVR